MSIPAKPLGLSLIQADLFWENKAANLALFEREIGVLSTESQVVLLPELFSTGFSMNRDLAEGMDGTTIRWLEATAKACGKILAGSVMIREGDRIFNRLVWMLPNGTFYHYDKRHLFAYGAEDEIFAAGNKRLIVQVNGWKICLMICYDLRFPVWSRQHAEPYDLLVYVANWPEKRSYAWKTLLRARAIENQCYVAGLNRVGIDGNGISYSGDSAIIDPLGEVLKSAVPQPATLTHSLEKDRLNAVRAHFPFLEDADRFLLV